MSVVLRDNVGYDNRQGCKAAHRVAVMAKTAGKTRIGELHVDWGLYGSFVRLIRRDNVVRGEIYFLE